MKHLVYPLLFALLIPVSYMFDSPPRPMEDIGFNFLAGEEKTGRLIAGIPINVIGWLSYKDSALKDAKVTISYVDINQRKVVEMERWYSKDFPEVQYIADVSFTEPGVHSLQIVATEGTITGALDFILDVQPN